MHTKEKISPAGATLDIVCDEAANAMKRYRKIPCGRHKRIHYISRGGMPIKTETQNRMPEGGCEIN